MDCDEYGLLVDGILHDLGIPEDHWSRNPLCG
jgi:hypothetical protein